MTSRQRSYIMSQIKPVSKIERVPKSLKGLNLRAHPKKVFGRPDFANKSKKVALFIDGCFWHSCWQHFKMPNTNPEFWENKIRKNRQRDQEVTERLQAEGWIVIRIWEHNLKYLE